MSSHPLDRPIWSALTSRQAAFGSDGAFARRFHEEIGPFAAAIDVSADAVAALGALTHADDDMSLLERSPPPPPAGVTLKMSAAGVQMVVKALNARGSGAPFEALSDADVPDMIALATLTKPDPFRAKTHTLGRFVGVREQGDLIAMAGERMQTDDFVEVSGICTHPDHRGRGLAAALTRVVTDRILREGRTPFLHAYAANTGAISVYRKLGFVYRCDVTHAIWSRDPG
jgi:ribosomal protein S18 acetylase RimI-like enzyme